MMERDKDAGKPEPQLSILSVSKRWWHVCVILLCVQTLVWMAFIWYGERDTAADWRELIEAVIYGTSNAIPLFIVLSLTMALSAEFAGGLAVVLAEYLKHKLQKRFEKRGEERGIATGREQANATWEAWYKRMKDAQQKGEPFDEPPPSMENGNSREN